VIQSLLSECYPDSVCVDNVIEESALPSYNEHVLAFAKVLSGELLNPKNKPFPELVALGFWLRSVCQRGEFCSANTAGFYKPLGCVVHFTPANVDTMFVYSWFASLLMGNINIVRLSSMQSEPQTRLLRLICDLLQQDTFTPLRRTNCFVRYDKASQITALLSAKADARILWGGDKAVMDIKAFATKPRSRDISFADRYSTSLINGNALNTENTAAVAALLWRDINPYNQQACSSPKSVLFAGDRDQLNALISELEIAASKTVSEASRNGNEQVVYAQWCSAQYNTGYTKLPTLCVVEAERFEPEMIERHPGMYCLLVHVIDSLGDIACFTNEKCQTLSYFGFEQAELVKEIQNTSITGIDRIVPVGHALDFSFDWDGYRLLESLSRFVDVK